jgi:Dyp-type peroxidase family
MSRGVDFADIQGLLRFGYGKMTQARFELLRIKDRQAARSWLASARVNDAVARDTPPKTALHIAFTAPGLAALGVPASVIEGFSHEFRTGMSTDYRGRLLGDVGANAKEHWSWGCSGQEPHLLAMLYAEPDCFEDHLRDSAGELWRKAFDTTRLPAAELDGTEPFGFADGLSEPDVDWEQRRETPLTQAEYTNTAALGEFLLGYRNEYGKLTERPLLEPNAGAADLPNAPDAPDKKDLGLNGTYLVVRQLSQDVRAFWRFVTEQAGGDLAKGEELAAAMVGRRRDGAPLAKLEDRETSGGRLGSKRNRFTFDEDQTGALCPFGAHIRRANPRNTDYPEAPRGLFHKLKIALGFGMNEFRYDVMSSVRFHRILRRGRKYGPPLSPEEALGTASPGEAELGLYFICLNANISRQFEFIQNAWIANTKFSAMTAESDPLLGNREPIPGCPVTSDFNMPRESGLRRRIQGLPRFVTVRGGAYFFLPGLRALRYIARSGSE